MQIKDLGFTLKGVQEKILLILAIKPGGGGGGCCHIRAILVCAAVKGTVFKQFTLA